MTHTRRRPSPRRTAVVATAVASAALLSLAAPSAQARPADADAAGTPNYVALGDSFASGAGLPEKRDKTCDRTVGSHPALLASSLNATFKDATCSGATTRSIWNHQGTKPPQAQALSKGTRLVTLTIGGNDIGFTEVLTRCVTSSFSDPSGSPCKKYFTAGGSDQLANRINKVESRIGSVLTDVRRRSPNAKVIVVGYPSLFPDSGVGCREVPIAKGDFAYLRDTTKRLNAVLQRQAAGHGVTYADTYTPTIGHDMCQPQERRWIEPLKPAGGALPAHPNATGQLVMWLAAYGALNK
ncbi:SGNH/GDSL hydrolase family protein [Streptomyces sp. NPDC098781]|uniref:SGNH/GDSL hydrolase family protein n=1 Tax=Streptomyces sp. NPDC098781 TaxID=3366097 RepID=UPI0038204D7A